MKLTTFSEDTRCTQFDVASRIEADVKKGKMHTAIADMRASSTSMLDYLIGHWLGCGESVEFAIELLEHTYVDRGQYANRGRLVEQTKRQLKSRCWSAETMGRVK